LETAGLCLPNELPRGKLRGNHIPSPAPRFPRFARASARAGFSAEGKRKRDKPAHSGSLEKDIKTSKLKKLRALWIFFVFFRGVFAFSSIIEYKYRNTFHIPFQEIRNATS
jgi:hypothetical protein